MERPGKLSDCNQKESDDSVNYGSTLDTGGVAEISWLIFNAPEWMKHMELWRERWTLRSPKGIDIHQPPTYDLIHHSDCPIRALDIRQQEVYKSDETR